MNFDKLAALLSNATNVDRTIPSRDHFQNEIQKNFENLDEILKITNNFVEQYYDKRVDQPMRIDPDRLGIVHPGTRIEIRNLNLKSKYLAEAEPNPNKLFFLDSIPLLFNYYTQVQQNEALMTIVQKWLNVFLSHFEWGYFTDVDLADLLVTLKTALVPINLCGGDEFVSYMYSFIRKFLKTALFTITDKIYSHLSKNRRKALHELKLGLHESPMNKGDTGINFGTVLMIIKKMSPSFYRSISDEVGMLQEIYFHNCVGKLCLTVRSGTDKINLPSRLRQHGERSRAAGVLLQCSTSPGCFQYPALVQRTQEHLDRGPNFHRCAAGSERVCTVVRKQFSHCDTLRSTAREHGRG